MSRRFSSKNVSRSKTGIIYALYDPSNPAVPKYIGQTRQSLRVRLTSHKYHANERPNIPLSIWLFSLYKKNLVPIIRALEQCDLKNLASREEAWIMFFRPLNCLTNISNGLGSKGVKGTFGGDRPENIKRLKKFNEVRKKVVIGDDGTKFNSVSQAYKALGVSEWGFRDCVRSGWRVKGRYWKILETKK